MEKPKKIVLLEREMDLISIVRSINYFISPSVMLVRTIISLLSIFLCAIDSCGNSSMQFSENCFIVGIVRTRPDRGEPLHN